MSPACRAILGLRDVGFSYNEKPLIDGLDLDVCEGDFTALLGANGSGKSTFLKLLSGILHPVAGEVSLWGKPILSLRHRDRAKLLSYLPQVLDPNVPFTVRELASMGLYPYDTRPQTNVLEALEMVGLKDKEHSLLNELSGGEKRRAFIAMTLVQGAGVLLLDEPLANLDIKYQIEIIRLLQGLNEKRNITTVMALHDINLAFHFKHVVLIKHGRLLKAGPPAEVLTSPLLEEAFDTEVLVHKTNEGVFLSYG